MSAHHQRKEKICLNCGSEVHGRYCHVCGQENVEPRESAWHLFRHFFEDITHFDGKFFVTLKYLLLRPGFLAREYMKGRRMAYLNPIRMYLLSSAIFFLLLQTFVVSHTHYDAATVRVREEIEHSAEKDRIKKGWGLASIFADSTHKSVVYYLQFNTDYKLNGTRAYDSLQRMLPDDQKDNRLERYLEHRTAAAAMAYHHDPNGFMLQMKANFFHSLSKILFISLPLFVLMLMLLYIRRKEFYFVAHAVFTIHYFCVFFLFVFLMSLLMNPDLEYASITFPIGMLMGIGLYVYLYVAMLKFYGQHWFKTLIKFIIQCAYFITLIIICTATLWVNSILSAGSH